VQPVRLAGLLQANLRGVDADAVSDLDLLVDTARGVDGVLGSRLTGAGFGGSTISLVHRSAIDTFQSVAAEAYLNAFDTAPRFFECVPSNGAGYR